MDLIPKILLTFTLLALVGCATQTVPEQMPEAGATYLSGVTMEMEPGAITTDTLKDHATTDSCYTVIDGLVYDITDYMEFSPSFKDTGMTNEEFRARLADSCGNDGTILFRELFGDNHYRLDSYLIGRLG